MKNRATTNGWIILAIVALCFVVVFAFMNFTVFIMASTTMEPIVPGERPNDIGSVCIVRATSRVKVNDLVLVSLPPVPGISASNMTIRLVTGVFTNRGLVQYRVTATGPNGIDSRQLGLVGAQEIQGKVVHVFK